MSILLAQNEQNSSVGGNACGQSFTTGGQSWSVGSVKLRFATYESHDNGANTVKLQMQRRTTSSHPFVDFEDDVVLEGHQLIGSYPTYNTLEFSFLSPLLLSSEYEYRLRITMVNSGSNAATSFCHCAASNENPYAGGIAYNYNLDPFQSRDLWFEIYGVEPVSPPQKTSPENESTWTEADEDFGVFKWVPGTGATRYRILLDFVDPEWGESFVSMTISDPLVDERDATATINQLIEDGVTEFTWRLQWEVDGEWQEDNDLWTVYFEEEDTDEPRSPLPVSESEDVSPLTQYLSWIPADGMYDQRILYDGGAGWLSHQVAGHVVGFTNTIDEETGRCFVDLRGFLNDSQWPLYRNKSFLWRVDTRFSEDGDYEIGPEWKYTTPDFVEAAEPFPEAGSTGIPPNIPVLVVEVPSDAKWVEFWKNSPAFAVYPFDRLARIDITDDMRTGPTVVLGATRANWDLRSYDQWPKSGYQTDWHVVVEYNS